MPLCPVCNNETLEEGEWVDYQKVTPDYCDNCGYMQQSPYSIEYNESRGIPTLAFFQKCWELQVSPYPGCL